MAKIKEMEKALKLRTEGFSIGEIAKSLNVSKSTVSGWCRDIQLSEAAIQKIAKKSKLKSTEALLKYSEGRRRERKRSIEKDSAVGKRMLGNLSNRDIFCIGLGLYWGEGYKRGSQEFGFTNSDPRMITFYIKWLDVVFGVKKEDLVLRVSINQTHVHRIQKVEVFWSKLTGVEIEQFTKSSLIKSDSKKVYTNQKDHMGTLRVKVRKGTSMRRQVIGAIAEIAV